MRLRSPLNVIGAIGAAGWPIGGFGLDGFRTATGRAIIGVGSCIYLAAAATELILRFRSRHQEPERLEQQH
jgi:hypothetical protein